MNCRHCHTEVSLHYCPNCGQPAVLKRIDGPYILRELINVLEFERGIFYTMRELLLHPGQNIRRYIAEDRSRLVKPVVFLLITSVIYSLVSSYFHTEDGYVKFADNQPSATSAIFSWVQANYGYANIIMGVFIALWTRLLFRKYGYNFFEILILLCFVMGMGMLIFAASALFQGLTGIDISQAMSAVGVVYCSWSIGQFFDKTKKFNYAKAAFSYILGMTTFVVLVLILGSMIERMV